MSSSDDGERGRSEFEALATAKNRPSQLAELVVFLRENKKWWLIPIVASLLLFAVLIVLSTTAAAPFVYTLF